MRPSSSSDLSALPLSVLSLAPVTADGTIASAFRHLTDIAVAAERVGYDRFWIAEHHNLASVTSAATSVLIGHVAGKTASIRVGSGGIMLPNHAPLVVAENFGTLATLYPDRIDLGLGRAPGTDPTTMRALRREIRTTGDDFPELVSELRSYFAPAAEGQRVRAVPGQGIDMPIWILGSSLWSADFAAREGLPYAFAAHFAPTYLGEAFEMYRSRFRPSAVLKKPKTMACVPVVAAASDREAEFLATTPLQKILGLIRGKRPATSPAPVDSMEGLWTVDEKVAVANFLREAIVGGPESVRAQTEAFVKRTGVDELMIHTDLHRTEDTVRSFEIFHRAVRGEAAVGAEYDARIAGTSPGISRAR